jgi:hypothetical protein
MFPQGGPGLALVLLRLSVAAMFALNAAHRSAVSSFHLLLAGVALTSLSLILGFLTPYLSALACGLAVASVLVGAQCGPLGCALAILDAAALALLGPGAYSVDARLFGRRVTVVPPRREGKAG